MAGPGGKVIRYSLRQSFMRWSILPGTFSFARFDRSAEIRMADKRSAPILAFVQGYSRFHQFPDECGGKRFVCGEVESSLGCGETLEFVFEFFNHRRRGKQTAVVRKGGEPHQHPIVLEGGHPIADDFRRLGRDSGANRRAHLVQGAASGFWNTGEVFIHIFRSDTSFRGGTALARFRFFHRRPAFPQSPDWLLHLSSVLIPSAAYLC